MNNIENQEFIYDQEKSAIYVSLIWKQIMKISFSK